MNYKVQKIDIGALALNQGQIEGLPANPRQWTREDIDKIAASLRETPELFEMRPCIVTPHGEQFVILAGSLRFCGARQNGDKDVPCIVFEGSTDKMREIVIKDNGSFGAWDFDALANEWEQDKLANWGVPVWQMPSTDTSFDGGLPDELDGVDLNPDDLEKLQGDDETATERIIICYKKEDAESLAAHLGLDSIDKVVYNYDELK